jgi:RNA polymerase sigma-70 factor, ECF subfamily
MASLVPRIEEADVVSAARAGDEAAFASLAERYRRELQVHCYRMLGSLEDAEDQVQETLLRAWRRRESFEGRSTFRAWLYRIATNACLDFLERHPRRPVLRSTADMERTDAVVRPPPHVAWLQPYPDALLEPVAPDDLQPEAAAIARETIGLAFLVALQLLPPKQRAVLILRDVLGWSTPETAAVLDLTTASVKSALQRARPTLKEHLPAERLEWAPVADPTEEEHALLRRFIDASERSDIPALTAMLREDAWQTMPPYLDWFGGREAMIAMWSAAMAGPGAQGEWRLVPTRANRQPAAANYLRVAGDDRFRASNVDVLRIVHGRIAEVTTFDPGMFPAFGLPLVLEAADGG